MTENSINELGNPQKIDPMNITDDNELIKYILKLAKKSKPFREKMSKVMGQLGKGAGQAIRNSTDISMQERIESETSPEDIISETIN